MHFSGVEPIKFYPKLLIDISHVSELTTHYLDVNLILGGNITITDTMNIFYELAKSNDDFWYLDIFHDHLQKVAHIPVRNVSILDYSYYRSISISLVTITIDEKNSKLLVNK